MGTYPLIRFLSLPTKPEDMHIDTSIADFDGDIDEYQASLAVKQVLDQHRVVVFSKVGYP